jgi:epoxide hydrolase 4
LQVVDPHTPGIRMQANRYTFHCIDAGPKDGPLVILLHGFPEFWWGWRYQIAPLAQAGFRVLVPDQRGYNLSDKPQGSRAYDLDTLSRDVVGLCDALGYGQCSLVGHDWGGLVAWWMVTRHPARIARVIVINAPHPAIASSYLRHHPSQMMKSAYIGFFQLPYLPERLLSANGYVMLRRSLLRTSRAGTFSEEDLAEYEKAWAQPGALTGMINWYRAIRRKPYIKNLNITVPTLVIWGIKDFYLENGLAGASLALCDDGRAIWIENGTHFVHLEEPEVVNMRILDFLKA